MRRFAAYSGLQAARSTRSFSGGQFSAAGANPLWIEKEGNVALVHFNDKGECRAGLFFRICLSHTLQGA